MVTHLIMKLLRTHQYLSIISPHRYYFERLLYVVYRGHYVICLLAQGQHCEVLTWNSVINFFSSPSFPTAPISAPFSPLHSTRLPSSPVKSVMNAPPSGIAAHRPPPCPTRCMSRWPDKQTISAPLTAQSPDSCGMRGRARGWLAPSISRLANGGAAVPARCQKTVGPSLRMLVQYYVCESSLCKPPPPAETCLLLLGWTLCTSCCWTVEQRSHLLFRTGGSTDFFCFLRLSDDQTCQTDKQMYSHSQNKNM